MTNRERLRRKREEIWRKNPNCFYCQRPTIWIETKNTPKIKNPAPNQAVLKHLVDRYDEKRQERPKEKRYVLCCYECANRVSKERELQLNKDMIRERAGRWPEGYIHGGIFEK